VAEVEVAAHSLVLPRGKYCIYVLEVSPGLPAEKLPGLTVAVAPGEEGSAVSLVRHSGEPWLRERGDAVLVQVHHDAVRLLLTSYNTLRAQGATPPRIEVQRLDTEDATLAAGSAALRRDVNQVIVHVSGRGDQSGRFGEWIGERGPGLAIEGFSVKVPDGLSADDIEYQALLGKGWLSPWASAGEYCGSRGMDLPILGVRLRLSEAAAKRFNVRASALFADGSERGPLPAGELVALDNLQPVAALKFEVDQPTSLGRIDKSAGTAPKLVPNAKPARTAPTPVQNTKSARAAAKSVQNTKSARAAAKSVQNTKSARAAAKPAQNTKSARAAAKPVPNAKSARIAPKPPTRAQRSGTSKPKAAPGGRSGRRQP
jgi:hypothetical protein